MSEAVVVFGKTAKPGNVKTRLTPEVTEKEAARLYTAFARDVLETVQRYCRGTTSSAIDAQPVLAWDGSRDDDLAREAVETRGFRYMEQVDGDLGARLRAAVGAVREDDRRRILIVGTDSPTLSPEHLSTASLLLDNSDVVFGPTFDGGYYLLGLDVSEGRKSAVEEVIFEDIPWSSRRVLEASWRRAVGADLLCELTGFWYDIDTIDDLKKARFHLFDYLADRQPKVGGHTRKLIDRQFGDIDER